MWRQTAIKRLVQGKMHYEQYVGSLEDKVLASAELDDAISQRLWFLELISWMLILHHIFLRRSLPFDAAEYSGLLKLMAKSSPLWVFSLNHDVCLEIVSATFDIPIATCAARLKTTSNQHPRDPVEIVTNAILAENIVSDHHFFKSGEHGLNLVKLHGSLNEFVDVDADGITRMVHFSPSALTPLKWVQLLGAINAGPWGESGSTVPLNHLPPSEAHPRPLMRTVLTGSHKMADERLLHRTYGGPALFSPKLEAETYFPSVFQRPEMTRPVNEHHIQRMFAVFDEVLPKIHRLVVIGCSLTDEHINERIGRWLKYNKRNKLSIVRPNLRSVPPFLDGTASQVEVIPMGTTEFLGSL
jgi:hypothetical protein